MTTRSRVRRSEGRCRPKDARKLPQSSTLAAALYVLTFVEVTRKHASSRTDPDLPAGSRATGHINSPAAADGETEYLKELDAAAVGCSRLCQAIS